MAITHDQETHNAPDVLVRREEDEHGTVYRRTVAVDSLLVDYEVDGDFGPQLLDQLGVLDGTTSEKMNAIAEAGDLALLEYADDTVAIAPYTHTMNEVGDLVYVARGVTPSEDNLDPMHRLGYLDRLVAYNAQKVNSFIDLLDGKSDAPELFRTDLANPSQYVHGSIADEPAKLYLVDIEPEVITVAEPDGYGSWDLCNGVKFELRDLAAAIYRHPEAARLGGDFLAIVGRMLEEGILDQQAAKWITYGLENGYLYPDEPDKFKIAA